MSTPKIKHSVNTLDHKRAPHCICVPNVVQEGHIRTCKYCWGFPVCCTISSIHVFPRQSKRLDQLHHAANIECGRALCWGGTPRCTTRCGAHLLVCSGTGRDLEIHQKCGAVRALNQLLVLVQLLVRLLKEADYPLDAAVRMVSDFCVVSPRHDHRRRIKNPSVVCETGRVRNAPAEH